MLKDKIIDLHRKGKSYNEISKILSCSKGTISYHLNDLVKSKTMERDKVRKQKVKDWLKEYKETMSCEVCGESHPATLQFHHTDPINKSFSISQGVSNRVNIKILQEEINKCQVLCANCHAKFHYEE